MRQHVVEVNFRVDTLRATVYKTYDDVERELGNVTLEQFSILFVVAKYTMEVDVRLRYAELVPRYRMIILRL